LLQQVLDRLGRNFHNAESEAFEELKVFLSGEKGGAYAEIGGRLGMIEKRGQSGRAPSSPSLSRTVKMEIANTVD